MLHAPNLAWSISSRVLPRLISEHGKEASITRVKVQVILIGLSEVGLFENERHAEHALPEIQGALLGGSYDRDVVNTLHLGLSHDELLERSM
jgi:hypothetical protein